MLPYTEPIIERSEEAYPTHDLDNRSQVNADHLKPGDILPPKVEKPSVEKKGNEQEVNNQDDVRKNLIHATGQTSKYL